GNFHARHGTLCHKVATVAKPFSEHAKMNAMTRWLDEEEQAAWRAFYSATTLLIDRLDRELQHDAGMPHAYYEILVVLSESPGRSLRMSELAVKTRSSRSRLSHAVAKLEKTGWVERRDCPGDKRGQLA